VRRRTKGRHLNALDNELRIVSVILNARVSFCSSRHHARVEGVESQCRSSRSLRNPDDQEWRRERPRAPSWQSDSARKSGNA
jgi:hypothetical protein